MNNVYGDKKGRYEISPVTIRTVDQAVIDFFSKKIKLIVDSAEGPKKVPVVFSIGERAGLSKNQPNLRDENGTLILPILSVTRNDIERTEGFGGMTSQVPYITVSSRIHEKTNELQNLIDSRKTNGFPETKKDKIIREYLTLPFPDSSIFHYTVNIRTQYQGQMNEMLEIIFASYDFKDSFVMPVEYDGDNPKGDSYYFVGFREGNFSPSSNVENMTDAERIIKCTATFRVPVTLILDNKTNQLSYGQTLGHGRKDRNKVIVYKTQDAVNITLKEQNVDFVTTSKK